MPLENVSQRSLGELPIHDACFNFHRNIELTVDRMEMSRAMLTVKHRNDNSKKPAKFRHPNILRHYGDRCNNGATSTTGVVASIDTSQQQQQKKKIAG
jgi:hypothetical protein